MTCSPQYGDIVHYLSPTYGKVLRVRVAARITTPHGKPGFDAVIIDENGEPDIAGYFFTSVWADDDQVVEVE